MICPYCGEATAADAMFCLRCGARLPAGCPNCGQVNPDSSQFCRVCGTWLADRTASTPPLPAATLCPRCRASNTEDADFCFSCGLPFDEQDRRRAPRPAYLSYAGRPAGFWIRLLAWIIDAIVLNVVWIVLIAIDPGVSLAEYYTPDASGLESWGWIDFADLLIWMAYYTVGVSVWATTIGKKVCGLYVLRPDGSKVGVGRAFARSLAPILSALILFIGYLMAAFRQDKRALHDLICDTVVVKR